VDYSYTFTPSRLIFPRGFLWDDGFHLSVALHSNPNKVINIIHNWLRKVDIFGWIGREQIRGFEISSMMPEVKFVYQDIFEMNPPTLILPILTLI
jgi:mannosyl-oligosaccharide glucosidase